MITNNYVELFPYGHLKLCEYDADKNKYDIKDVSFAIQPFLFYDCEINLDVTFWDIYKLISKNECLHSVFDIHTLPNIEVCKESKTYYEYLTFAWDVVNYDDELEIMPVILGNDEEPLMYNDIEDILDLYVKINSNFTIRSEDVKDISGKSVSFSNFGDLRFSLFDVCKLVIDEIKLNS
jgi:hypothetical protein